MGHVVQDGVRRAGGKKIAIPIGKQDATVFRKVMSAKDAISEFAPALGPADQERALRIARVRARRMVAWMIRTYLPYFRIIHQK